MRAAHKTHKCPVSLEGTSLSFLDLSLSKHSFIYFNKSYLREMQPFLLLHFLI